LSFFALLRLVARACPLLKGNKETNLLIYLLLRHLLFTFQLVIVISMLLIAKIQWHLHHPTFSFKLSWMLQAAAIKLFIK
jgi:hypothetical protein